MHPHNNYNNVSQMLATSFSLQKIRKKIRLINNQFGLFNIDNTIVLNYFHHVCFISSMAVEDCIIGFWDGRWSRAEVSGEIWLFHTPRL